MTASRDISVRKQGTANENGNEQLEEVIVTHLSHDPLSYVLLFQSEEMGGIRKFAF